MGQIAIVELLTLQVVTELARPQIISLDAIFLEKLLVCHTEGLANSLGYDLGLDGESEN